MQYKNRGRVGFCALASAAILIAGCSGSDSMVGNSANSGRVHIVLGGAATQAAMRAPSAKAALTDDMGRTITSAVISLSSVLARNLDGQLIDVTIALPVDVDLVGLLQGGTVDLPIGALPPGSYDQLVIVIKSLHVVLSDGTQIDVTPPGGGWTAIVPATPFDVIDGQVTTVTLHFRASGAFQWNDGHLDFNPGFDCETDHHHNGGDDNEQ
jgi:hypothetical protein